LELCQASCTPFSAKLAILVSSKETLGPLFVLCVKICAKKAKTRWIFDLLHSIIKGPVDGICRVP
jgi:hypothetical protein